MKLLLIKRIAISAFCLLLFTSSSIASEEGYDWLKQRLEAAKAYTIQVFEAMPAEDYSYKPNDDQRTFGAQAYHIVYTIDYFLRAFPNNGQAEWSPGDENGKTKAELIAWANEEFDAMNKYILESESNDQLTAGIVSYLDHNAHHRGQIVTYLRMKGIAPPSYR